MSIDNTTKIDASYKFIHGKAYTSTTKLIDNEEASTMFVIGTNSIIAQDSNIPNTAPGVTTAELTFYGDGTNVSYPRFKMVYDISSPLNKTWYASIDGSTIVTMRNTRVQNWITPMFGNYNIRIFLTVGSSTTSPFLLEIFFSDATCPLFDYKAGILTFTSDPLLEYASYPGGPPDGIQISGYNYAGLLLSQVFDANGNFTGGLSDLSTNTSLAKFIAPNKTFEISSPFAIPTTWISEITSYGTSSVSWFVAGQFPNGEGIVSGVSSGIGVISYSWGYGIWKNADTISGSLATSTSIWCAPDDLTAYVTDATGQIFKTVNSGRDWINLGLQAFTTQAVWGTSLVDIFVCGNGGNIIHSTNSISFTAQVNSDVHDLYAIHGSSSSDIFAVGAGGTIRHSTGAGTWTGQSSGTANDLYSVFAVSPTEIYVGGTVGTLLKSSGGGTWTSFNSGIAGTFSINAIYCISNGNTKKIYVSGLDSSSNNYKIYVSAGINSWTLEATYAGPETQRFIIAGGAGGIFGGLSAGRVALLHKNPIELVHGNSRYDGYVDIHGSVNAKNADFFTLNTGSYISVGAGIATGGFVPTNNNIESHGNIISVGKHYLASSGTAPTAVHGGGGGGAGYAVTIGSTSNDVHGQISIQLGATPPGGALATITLAGDYASIPHIILTPSSTDAAIAQWYLGTVAIGVGGHTTFQINANATGLIGGNMYVFNYWVISSA